jgi:hypothetical protein
MVARAEPGGANPQNARGRVARPADAEIRAAGSVACCTLYDSPTRARENPPDCFHRDPGHVHTRCMLIGGNLGSQRFGGSFHLLDGN